MTSWWLLFKNEVKLQYFEMRQYWFETLASLLLVCGLFIALFFGVKSFVYSGEQAPSLNELLFGFLLWSFASAAYMSVTKTVVEDTQKGYIEQLFLSPKGFSAILFIKTLTELLSGFIFLTLIAYLTMWLTGNWIEINFLGFYAALLLGAPSLIGLGLFMSGLALVYKRVDTVAHMLTLALLGLVAVDGLPISPITLLPFTPCVSLAKSWGLYHGSIDVNSLFVVLINSIVYLSIGIMTFKRFERIAKQKNLIGQY